MSEEIKILPKEWKWAKLGDIANYLNGRVFKSSEWEINGKPIIRIQNLNKPKAKYNYTTQQFEDKYKVVKGDLLFSWSASLGVYIWRGEEAWLNQHIFKIVPQKHVYKHYIYYLLKKITAELYASAHGSGMVHVTKRKFEAKEIPLPPLPTQEAIVAKIEMLFSELDNGIALLKTAQQQLDTYRQSVLKWAFEGKLTNKNVKDGELPKGWEWVKLGDVAESVRNGYSKKPDDAGDKRILRISSVRPLNLNTNDYRLLLEDIGDKELIEENDLLFTRYNGSRDYVGVCARVPKLDVTYYYPDKLIRCRLSNKDNLHSKYIMYAVNQGASRQYVLKKIKTTAGQSGISGTEIKNIPLPLCSIKEQSQIVQEIESRLSVADKLQETITASLAQAESLRQSILKQAFEGKLV